mgnify:CR=1 FL=1
MISIHNISKAYNGKKVLGIESLEIPKGETFGLVGNNGAGKTTLFSVLELKSTNPKLGNLK